jgi:hypothetical protein
MGREAEMPQAESTTCRGATRASRLSGLPRKIGALGYDFKFARRAQPGQHAWPEKCCRCGLLG